MFIISTGKCISPMHCAFWELWRPRRTKNWPGWRRRRDGCGESHHQPPQSATGWDCPVTWHLHICWDKPSWPIGYSECFMLKGTKPFAIYIWLATQAWSDQENTHQLYLIRIWFVLDGSTSTMRWDCQTLLTATNCFITICPTTALQQTSPLTPWSTTHTPFLWQR